METLKEFTGYFISCSKTDQGQIVSFLADMMNRSSNTALEELQQTHRKIHGVNCPHCQGRELVANGRNNGVQRYRCKECGKNFSETTGTPLAWLKKKGKWAKYLHCMLSGYSIRKCASEVGICIQTSFDWRHKALSAFKEQCVEGFEGIVESDDIFFLYSEKGSKTLKRKARKRGSKATKRGISDEQVAVVVTCDRKANKELKVATRGRISKKDLDKALGGKLEKADVLCTDSHHSYTAFAKGQKITHKKFNASKGQRVKDKVYHVQNVNNTAKRLRQWMQPFNGVSTKYLQNYLNWFAVLEQLKNSTERLKSFVLLALSCNQAWWEFKDIAINNMVLRT